jgi:putative hydrolase of HD superfamily
MELDGILKFTKLTTEFQKIERVLFNNGSERNENDVEHSYQLALVGWYIVSTYELPLNIDLVIKYGLLHDLVEVYAGDTYIFDPDPERHASKVDREHQALLQLKKEFPEFPELTDLIETYEKREDEESKFVYALDKLIAPINIYLDGGRTWNEHKITFQQIRENKTPKVAVHTEVKKYFDQFMELLEKEKDKLFSKENEKI